MIKRGMLLAAIEAGQFPQLATWTFAVGAEELAILADCGFVPEPSPAGVKGQRMSVFVPTSPDTVHVHCASRGLARPPLRPIFEPGRVTVQPFVWGIRVLSVRHAGRRRGHHRERRREAPPLPAQRVLGREHGASVGVPRGPCERTDPGVLPGGSQLGQDHTLRAVGFDVPDREHTSAPPNFRERQSRLPIPDQL